MRPDDRKYMKSHEWAKLEGDPAEGAVLTVGLTDFAIEQLTDLVFVEMPAVGDRFKQGDAFGVIESVKAVSDIYAPVSGEVIEVNEAIDDGPETVNADPYGEGWLFKVRITAPGEVESLLDAAAYESHLAAD